MKLAKICLLTASICSLLTFSSFTQAMCGESKSICYHYKGNKLIKKSSCNITECGNGSGGLQRWAWKNGDKTAIDVKNDSDGTPAQTLVNDKPGFDIQKGNKYCYGVNMNKNEVFCSVD